VKINGYPLPIKDILVIATGVFWLSGLSFQVNSNAEDIKDQEDTKERLARIEVTQKATQEDVREVKEEQKEQRTLLVKILEKVSEN